jgi:hypothetical protein
MMTVDARLPLSLAFTGVKATGCWPSQCRSA